MRRLHARLSAMIIGLVLLAACAPSPSGSGAAQPGAPAPQREKTLTAMVQREVGSFDTTMTSDRGSARAGGAQQYPPLVDDGLSLLTQNGREPRLAAEIPDLSKGTVSVNADGSMDVTWKLKPNIFWHDGVPVTADDYLFRRRVLTELNLVVNTGPIPLLSVTAPDPKTVVIRYGGTYVDYAGASGIGNLPKHILGELYEKDKDALPQSRYFTTEFVGTGPFKLIEWVPGSHMEFRGFEQYYRGVPKVHRLILRFVSDVNTMVANLLAGSVELALPEGIDLEKAIELRERWKQDGYGEVTTFPTTALFYLELMVDPQYARPIRGLPVKEVRQGLYHAIDRAGLTDLLSHGLTPVADSQYAPSDPYYPLVKDVIPQYPYDLRKAQQLVEQAGWTKGPDGILVHPPSGPTQGSPFALPATGEERFDLNSMVFAGAQMYLKLGIVIQDNWKQIGVNNIVEQLTPAHQSDASYTSTRTGTFTSNPGGTAFYTGRLHSTSIPVETNRWSGSNRGRYSNPEMDQLLTTLAVTLEPTEQQRLHRRNLELTMGEAMMFPLYWETLPVINLKGVSGVKIAPGGTIYDLHEWDKN
ncbi:MAG: hypothetical protein HY534_01085 [Chloroflexi bacterium]|nr:hypothetical protein [Chloroflexota bacterium]